VTYLITWGHFLEGLVKGEELYLLSCCHVVSILCSLSLIKWCVSQLWLTVLEILVHDQLTPLLWVRQHIMVERDGAKFHPMA
jgi:hypothetical protein